jgi:hypothetical protein
MSTSAVPEEQASYASAVRPEPPPQPIPLDAIHEVLVFNGENPEHETLWSRTRQIADQAKQAAVDARRADTRAANADLSHKALQAEYPDRTAPRGRQWGIALGALTLDGVACYIAAAALGGSQLATLVWSGLFLALLGAGEVTLDLWHDSHRILWRWTAGLLGLFIAMLCILRFWYLLTVSTDGIVGAVIGACLFSLLTAAFVILGYKALRAAETSEASKARRRARSYARAAVAAWHQVGHLKIRRNRLAQAYMSRIRARLIKICTADQLASTEQAILEHLIGGDES